MTTQGPPDNGSRSTDDHYERQHREEGPGNSHWWRCVSLGWARREADRAYDAALDDVMAEVLADAGSYGETRDAIARIRSRLPALEEQSRG